MLGRMLALLALCLLAATCALAGTLPATLSDSGAPGESVRISNTTGTGIDQWNIANVNQMARNWFWFRIGAGPGTASAIDTISAPVVTQFTSTYARLLYSNANYSVQVDYLLTPGLLNGGTSDLAQTVTISNKTASALDFHLFQLVNFDLNNTAGNDVAVHDAGSGNIIQTDGAYPGLQAQVGVNGFNHWEIDSAATLFNKINGTSFTNLSDSVGTGTGDVAWGSQSNFTVAAHGSAQMSEDLLVAGAPVPETGTLASLGLGLLSAVSMIRRRR